MTIQDKIQDWYESEVIDPNNKDYMFCPYCNERIYRTRFYKHVKFIHGRTFEEMIEECCLQGPLPTCPYPGCSNILVLKQATKIGMGLQKFCCSQHGSSFMMMCMRNDPVLRAKHAREASERLRANNPTRTEENRRKASSRMTKNWESDEYRNKVSASAKKNIMDLLQDESFLEKKSNVASKRMIKMNREKDFLNKSAMGRIAADDNNIAILYVMVYKTFIKVGVTKSILRRMRALKGFEYLIRYDLPAKLAAEIEYNIKQKFETFKGQVPERVGKTEIFPLSAKPEIVKFIRESAN